MEGANDAPQYESLKNKFVSLAVPAVDAATALRIQEMVLNLEQMTDIASLMQKLA